MGGWVGGWVREERGRMGVWGREGSPFNDNG